MKHVVYSFFSLSPYKYIIFFVYILNMSSRPQPQQLNSQSLNPASLMEINVLKRVAMEQQKTNVQASIPYYAKICQIVDNQRLPDNDTMPLNTIRADAHAQLADAYYKVQNWIQCEASLMVAVKIWERMLEMPEESDGKLTAKTRLGEAYDILRTCYNTLGKSRLAELMEKRKSKLAP